MPVLKCCAEPGCATLLTQGGRCAKHYRPKWANRPGNGSRRYSAEHDRESKRLRAIGTLCDYCGQRPMWQLDHAIPISQGGQDIASNRRPICKICHTVKTHRESKG